jgi:hypothetical protein
MTRRKLPKTDSVQELAKFWDTHDLSDFEGELEEVAEPVFVGDAPIELHLRPTEAEAVRQMAQTKGVSSEDLLRQWVLQKIGNHNGSGQRRKTTATGSRGRKNGR